MKLITLIAVILSLFITPLYAGERKQWKAPEIKQGQTIKEAIEEFKQKKNQKKQEKKSKGFDFDKKRNIKEERQKKRATKSEIDWLEPRQIEPNNLMDFTHDILFLGD